MKLIAFFALALAVLSGPALAQTKPNFAMRDGLAYGYEAALSLDAIAKGAVTQPLHMVRYLGRRGGSHQIFYKPTPNVIQVMQCDDVCRFAKVFTYVDESHTSTETIRAVPGSLIALMFQDASNGHLEQFLYVRGKKKQAAWVEASGAMKFHEPPSK